MYIDDNNTAILDATTDKEDYPLCCGMYDENDEGYTRALPEVFIDRLQDMLMESDEEKFSTKIEEEIKKLRRLEENVEFMIIRD